MMGADIRDHVFVIFLKFYLKEMSIT